MLSRKEYADYCGRFHKAWAYMKKNSVSTNQTISEICEIRGYEYEWMSGTLEKAEFIRLNDDFQAEKLKRLGDDLALFNSKGEFRLSGRYIFPVKDMLGNVLALIGWYPDEKKYVTTPSKLFSKSCLFYGMEQMHRLGLGGEVFLVEGIFDSLSIRSLGYPALAMMGISASRYKIALYSLFKNIVAIPDIDEQGSKVIKFDKWSIPRNSKYFRWTGISPEIVKDIDTFIHSFEEDDVRELLSEIRLEKKHIVTYEF